MKLKLFITLLSAFVVGITSIFPSTVVLASTQTRWGEDYIVDNPEWGVCLDGAVFSEHTIFHIEYVERLDKDGNPYRLTQKFRYVEGGLTLQGENIFIPWKVERDMTTDYDYPADTKWKGVFNSALLTLPGYGKVVHWTGVWVAAPDSNGNFVLVHQSGQFWIDMDAICAYFGHPN